MKIYFRFLTILLATALFAGYSDSREEIEHLPFKEQLYIGPGYEEGSSNVLRGALTGNPEVLVSKNIGDQPIGWRCGLDTTSWYMFNASNTENQIFDLNLKNPAHLILQKASALVCPVSPLHPELFCIYLYIDTQDQPPHRAWQRGPFGPSRSFQLTISDADKGDLVLLDADGKILWSARRDGV